jgi:hypothetical protein
MILGLPWLQETNPTINWASGEVHLPSLPRLPRHDSSWAVAQHYLVRYLDLDPDKKITRLLQSIFYHIASICSRSYVALIFCGDYTLTTGTIACTS